MQKLNNLIKVCPDLHCEAVYHNVQAKQTRCKNCGGWIIKINDKTYWKKFSENFFQYDYTTEEFYRPEKITA